jgi:hypothetical protein
VKLRRACQWAWEGAGVSRTVNAKQSPTEGCDQRKAKPHSKYSIIFCIASLLMKMGCSNLCACRWLDQINENGTAEEFRNYWNNELTVEQREVCLFSIFFLLLISRLGIQKGCKRTGKQSAYALAVLISVAGREEYLDRFGINLKGNNALVHPLPLPDALQPFVPHSSWSFLSPSGSCTSCDLVVSFALTVITDSHHLVVSLVSLNRNLLVSLALSQLNRFTCSSASQLPLSLARSQLNRFTRSSASQLARFARSLATRSFHLLGFCITSFRNALTASICYRVFARVMFFFFVRSGIFGFVLYG